jgi:hypothetical protein
MKKPKLSEIRAREQAATEGPWMHGADDKDCRVWVSLNGSKEMRGKVVLMALGTLSDEEILNNVRFAAHSRTDIPHLLELVKRLEEALEEHGDHNLVCKADSRPGCTCGWDKARELLQEIKE